MNNIISHVKQHIRLAAFALVTIFLLFIFDEALIELIGRVTNEERYSHAPLVFLVAVYLIWIKRYEISLPNRGAWYGVAIATLSGAALVIGELSDISAIVQYSIVLLCFGLAWSMLGYQIKKIAIPFLLVLLVIPLPYMLDVMLSGKMQLISSNLGVSISRLFGLSVFQEGNVIDLGIYKLQVVEACSGLNYMYPLMTIGLLMGYMYKAPLYIRIILFLSSVPISVVMNSCRIAMVALLVNHNGIKAAEGFMHYFEGWVIFLLCILLMLLEVKIFNWLIKSKLTIANSFDYLETTKNTAQAQDKVVVNKAPILVSLAVILIASFSTLSIHHRVEVIPDRVTFSEFPLEIDGWKGRRYEFENGENLILRLKDYLLVNYNKANTSINVYMGYTDSQRDDSVPHSPKSCIPGGGWEISDTRLQEIVVDSHTKFKVTRMLISKGEAKQLVYYWFRQRGRDLSNEFPMKFAMLYDAIKINRTDGALLRFTTVVYNSEEDADKVLSEFIQLNYPLLPRYIPN